MSTVLKKKKKEKIMNLTDDQRVILNVFFNEIQDLHVDLSKHSWLDILAMIEDIKFRLEDDGR